MMVCDYALDSCNNALDNNISMLIIAPASVITINMILMMFEERQASLKHVIALS